MLGAEALWEATAEAFRPRTRLRPLDFGDEHRVYSKEGRASRWRSRDTPWAVEILWALSEDSPYTRIIVPKGTQLGLTEIGLIWIGQGMTLGQSALVIEPTEAIAKRIVRTKFKPMLSSTTILHGIFTGRASAATLHFEAPTVDVMFAGSNSPTNFASVTVPRAMGDEVDRWSPELLDEGDPIDLLANRVAEYDFLGKLFLPSSPTVAGASLVWREFEQSDQRYFQTPCPACEAFMDWRWEDLHWTAGEPETVKMACRSCGVLSGEHEWKRAWGAGRWAPTVERPVRSDTIGFHLSTLYARFGQRSWAQLVQQFEAATASGLSARLQVFHNTILGLPWKVSEDTVQADELKSGLDPAMEKGVVPEGALLLTAGVDYQKNRVEAFVYGWGRQQERWLVDKVVVERLTGDGKMRSSEAIADDLKDRALEKDWPHAAGGTLRVEMALHDSGDQPADVFDVLEHLDTRKNIASKGVEGWGKTQRFTTPKVQDVKRNGKVVRTGRRLMIVHTAEAKRDWFDDLRRPKAEHGPSERRVNLGEWVTEDEGLLEQFVAEELRKSTRGKLKWHKTGPNEALDCAILARGAHWQLKAHRWAEAEWAQREIDVGQVRAAARPQAKAASATTAGGRRIRARM